MSDSFRWKEVRTICVSFQTLVLETSHGFRKLFFSLILSCLQQVFFFFLSHALGSSIISLFILHSSAISHPQVFVSSPSRLHPYPGKQQGTNFLLSAGFSPNKPENNVCLARILSQRQTPHRDPLPCQLLTNRACSKSNPN